MLFKAKRKWAALIGLVLSLPSLVTHLFLFARYSSRELLDDRPIVEVLRWRPHFDTRNLPQGSFKYRKLWGPVKSLESLYPYAKPRGQFPAPSWHNNGYIFVKIQGGFREIRSSICDVVAVSRLLNATLVIPELQETTSTKGISSKFKSFGYLYNEDHFIAALANDVLVVKSLPKMFKNARKNDEIHVFTPHNSASSEFYLEEVLKELKKKTLVVLLVSEGGCLQAHLPPSLSEIQRLRCRVAFHALRFRPEVQELGFRIVQRLQASGRPYLAFHTGLEKEALAYHGCAERFQDIHAELIRRRRSWMIRHGIIQGERLINSEMQRQNGSCPLMPEEVGILLRAMGYPHDTVIYISGGEIFGGQRVLVPLRAMFGNVVDRTSLSMISEMLMIYGPEDPLVPPPSPPPPLNSEKMRLVAWNRAGPRPRPLPPPAERSKDPYTGEIWWGQVAEVEKEPRPKIRDSRMRAHKLLWEAIDYIVCVEADAFFPGFDRDGNGRPNFASLVMGHRVYESASLKTFRPDRKVLVKLLEDIQDHIYKPNHTWLVSVQEHLNKTTHEEGLKEMSQTAKPLSFLSHPLPECSCQVQRDSDSPHHLRSIGKTYQSRKMSRMEDRCPLWMTTHPTVPSEKEIDKKEDSEEIEETSEQFIYDMFDETDTEETGSESEDIQSMEREEELDVDD
ncbi:hypothetical protein SUGI_0320260 [Cryptomeria japonica]|uniref:protein EMBRYO SAC DEVELOPMENT ARREST 30 isoform X3 n=1 Tax=Cryptomeria japonica TaxID=3369 RepID=UPI002408CE3B|nr:protein EMBRYO SAC DEVELOPMENT ARREST 30 isoform X3 [Cryptomeria japonica]XP_057815670.1 protein EMBRYO SAC DEVELOPMENT ARREST 30 isoform X3 [Cryptomeria japonica]XP_057815675.1 protein EMBRYO SAC DEVELOPMENT ARREST 30 isoform X3 [Cryptomeria japonica]XP_057815680.1 protein EMBRYO SAC DEVELOPMENT ARREST 30 isoform X3 [Cryptomeria japonica]GLJ18130.1 hypothetical protein SUGI_0320260 [Cryptomeria japonica]